MTILTIYQPKKISKQGGIHNQSVEPPPLPPHLFSNQARRTNKDGKEYLVVPGVPVQEQVMNTYLLPAEEIQKSLTSWNGTPLSIRHPQQNNGSVNVDNPDVPIIGHFDNAHWDMNSKRMLGDYWIDLEKTTSLPEGMTIINAINAGQMLETSTAYWADEEMNPGFFKGRAYQTIHRNPKRDHIAIFPDQQVGACNIQDGCGVNRNMQLNCEQCMVQNVTGNLPASGKALWERVYEANKDKGEESAAKIAWAACKKAGWSKNDKDEWVKKNEQLPPYRKGYLPTALLIGYSLNKGSRTQEQLDIIRKQVKEHGITKPVWIQCNGSIKILDGNHRVALAQEFGIEQVPVKVVDSHLIDMDPEAVYRKWMHEKDQDYLL